MTKSNILLLILGLVLGFGGTTLYHNSEMEAYQKEISRLGQITDQLKGQLAQLENKEDLIKEEVKNEQANKSTKQILIYWTSAYKSSGSGTKP